MGDSCNSYMQAMDAMTRHFPQTNGFDGSGLYGIMSAGYA